MFIVIIGVIFYAADSFARKAPPITFEGTDGQDVATNFIAIIDALNAVTIDPNDIEAVTGNDVIQIPNIQISVPTGFGQIGKENPFSPLSGPLTDVSSFSTDNFGGLTPPPGFSFVDASELPPAEEYINDGLFNEFETAEEFLPSEEGEGFEDVPPSGETEEFEETFPPDAPPVDIQESASFIR